MIRFGPLAIMTAACLLLGACARHDHPGKDQLVATLGKTTITVADLKAEETEPATNPRAVAALDRATLQFIVERKLLAQEARTEHLDKSPQVERATQAAIEGVLAQAMVRKVLAQAPAPSSADISKSIADNSQAFAGRKFLVVEELQLMGPMPAMPATQPPVTMADYEAFLDKAKVPYQHRMETVDTGATDPKLLRFLLSAPLNAAFQVNNGRQVMVTQIRQIEPAPLSGVAAVAVAKNYLASQATEGAVKDHVASLRQAAKVRYEPGYEPPAITP